jgi:hypothetical protein
MSTTTTNFGWTVPSDTDLVKDGAAAIRTALGGVDTSFVDLKGGTTGQVLSKASGTDLDFSWVTASGGGNFTKVTSGTFSGSANFSVDSIFSSTYANYKIIIVGTSGGGTAASIKLRFRTGGTTNTTSNYSGGRNSTIYSTGGSEIDTSNNDSSMTLGRTDSNGGWWLSFDCLNPFESQLTSAIGGHTDVSRGGASSGPFKGTTSFDGINIFGGANLAGSYYIYGYGN